MPYREKRRHCKILCQRAVLCQTDPTRQNMCERARSYHTYPIPEHMVYSSRSCRYYTYAGRSRRVNLPYSERFRSVRMRERLRLRVSPPPTRRPQSPRPTQLNNVYTYAFVRGHHVPRRTKKNKYLDVWPGRHQLLQELV